jgi:hypothetical protein
MRSLELFQAGGQDSGTRQGHAVAGGRQVEQRRREKFVPLSLVAARDFSARNGPSCRFSCGRVRPLAGRGYGSLDFRSGQPPAVLHEACIINIINMSGSNLR